MSTVLADKDVNTSAPGSNLAAVTMGGMGSEKLRNMEYHRQVLANRMAEEKAQQTYISPSDTIMSPCTAKLSAMKSKHILKVKPQSLFAKTSSKNAHASSSLSHAIFAKPIEPIPTATAFDTSEAPMENSPEVA